MSLEINANEIRTYLYKPMFQHFILPQIGTEAPKVVLKVVMDSPEF
jgi:hypothetical protein